MGHLVILNLGNGNWDQGCPSVIAQLQRSENLVPMQFTGSLPPAPELGQLYVRWQRLYRELYAYKHWQSLRTVDRHDIHQTLETDDIEIVEDDITNISDAEFNSLCDALRDRLNTWLDAPAFRPIERQLRTRLAHADPIRLIVTATNQQLLQLPWFLWQFFDDYPNAEPALSLSNYTAAIQTAPPSSQGEIRILSILGNSQGIDVAGDRQVLEQLPHAKLRILVEPDLPSLTHQLWEANWDVLCFAGHSSSQGKGTIQVNPTHGLTLQQLRYGLKRAIAHGLKLAIFNSCDGLRLAWDLADLQIPLVIVMRGPVPDRVAQEFLKSFLRAFSSGQSLYAAVREAREKLQGLEAEFPCATWLPVICQNPAEPPPSWPRWQKQEENQSASDERRTRPLASPLTNSLASWNPGFLRFSQRQLPALLLSSLMVTVLMLIVRSLGILQPLELWAFDRLLLLRPPEFPDARFLIVTIDETDIAAQNPAPRPQSSLADGALEQLLKTLQPYQPRVIGLDLYRDFPVQPEYANLARQLQQSDRFIAVCKRTDVSIDPSGIRDPKGLAAPPEVPASRLGFSDFLDDPDGVVRRHLLAITPGPDAACPPADAFSAQLAFHYLAAEGITPEFTEAGIQLGTVLIRRLPQRANGYQAIDAAGFQLLLNYRALPSPQLIAPQVSLRQILNGQFNLDTVTNRIVLIGVIAPSRGDFWSTPYGQAPAAQVPGVFVQAQMTSQLLSAVLDGRPLLSVWPIAGEWIWIWGWAIVGGAVVWAGRSPLQQGLAGLAAVGLLTGCSLVLLIQGYWVPLIPAIGALVTTGSMVGYLKSWRE